VRIIGRDGYGLELRIVDYQFPDAADERLRKSWIVVAGTARSPEGTWSFRWQALTPEDARDLALWLRRAADGDALEFVEPNLSFVLVERTPDEIVLRIGLDLEFSPPWRKHDQAGDPYTIVCRAPAADVLEAAAEWEVESARYPG
jgi:hypothetical protein